MLHNLFYFTQFFFRRPNDDLSLPPNKRAKFNSHNSPRTLQLDRPTSSVREEDFLVPVNHGTEEVQSFIFNASLFVCFF